MEFFEIWVILDSLSFFGKEGKLFLLLLMLVLIFGLSYIILPFVVDFGFELLKIKFISCPFFWL